MQKLDDVGILLGQVESMDRATLVRSVLNGKDTDFPGRDKWEERLFAAKGDLCSAVPGADSKGQANRGYRG